MINISPYIEQDKAMDKSTSDTWGSDILEKTLFHRSHSDGSIDTTKSEESSFTCQSLPATPAVDTDRYNKWDNSYTILYI